WTFGNRLRAPVRQDPQRSALAAVPAQDRPRAGATREDRIQRDAAANGGAGGSRNVIGNALIGTPIRSASRAGVAERPALVGCIHCVTTASGLSRTFGRRPSRRCQTLGRSNRSSEQTTGVAIDATLGLDYRPRGK